jgi:hypothetical protein
MTQKRKQIQQLLAEDRQKQKGDRGMEKALHLIERDHIARISSPDESFF